MADTKTTILLTTLLPSGLVAALHRGSGKSIQLFPRFRHRYFISLRHQWIPAGRLWIHLSNQESRHQKKLTSFVDLLAMGLASFLGLHSCFVLPRCPEASQQPGLDAAACLLPHSLLLLHFGDFCLSFKWHEKGLSTHSFIEIVSL